MPQNEKENVTVRHLARRLGISPATVSLALNGRRPTSFVSAATRKQVWKAAEEMGYPLDRLRSRRTLLERVALFGAVEGNTIYGESLLELCRILNEHKILVLTHSLRTEREAQETALELYRRQEIDAAVFVGSRTRKNTQEPITPETFGDLPCVFIGEVPPGSVAWQVRPDNEGGGRAVGEHLWALGHRSVGMVLLSTDVLVGNRRLAGLRAAWAAQGREIPESHILHVDAPVETLVHSAIAKFVAENPRADEPATALFCFNDWVAGTVIKALRRLNVRVPEDISVVGFDNWVYADLIDPPLTTVHHPFDQLGVMAAELLFRQMESPDAKPSVAIAPCHLVGRQSCAVPPNRTTG